MCDRFVIVIVDKLKFISCLCCIERELRSCTRITGVLEVRLEFVLLRKNTGLAHDHLLFYVYFYSMSCRALDVLPNITAVERLESNMGKRRVVNTVFVYYSLLAYCGAVVLVG